MVGHRSIGICIRAPIGDIITERACSNTLSLSLSIFVRIGSGEMGSGGEPTSAIFAVHSMYLISFLYTYIIPYFWGFVNRLFVNFL